MYYLLAICLALAALLAINSLASLAGAVLWRVIKNRTRSWTARTRAGTLFVLRTLPPLASLVCVGLFLLPAYIIHEPPHAVEEVSWKLGGLALVSFFGIACAVWRGLAAWGATQRLVADWLRRAEPIPLEGINVPAYAVEKKFPVVAIVGTFRPQLFIAKHLLTALDREELRAVVLHERGHLAARDNFKRTLVRACRDVLMFVPCGRALDRTWVEESEASADEYAARTGGESSALALAAALVKIARLVPPAGNQMEMPAGAFLLEKAGEGITARVRRLTQIAAEIASVPNTSAAHNISRADSGFKIYAVACLLALTATLIILTQTNVLHTLHLAIEHFVHALR